MAGEMKPVNGFTLLELLVAVSLLSLVMMSGIYAYSAFSYRWQDELGQFKSRLENLQSFNHIQRVLENIKPYVIHTKDSVGFLFIGKSSSIVAVRNATLFGDSNTLGSEVFKLSLVPTNQGYFNLLYQSHQLANGIIVYDTDTISYTRSKILANNVKSMNVEYSGYENVTAKYNRLEYALKLSWYNEFSGLDRALTPNSIRLTLEFDSGKVLFLVDLDSESERHLTSYGRTEY